jgi:hypothetical protein
MINVEDAGRAARVFVCAGATAQWQEKIHHAASAEPARGISRSTATKHLEGNAMTKLLSAAAAIALFAPFAAAILSQAAQIVA